MSEAKPTRSVQEIQNEYSNLCFKAGNLQYEIECKQGDLKTINSTLRDLNFEFVTAKNLEAEVVKKVAEASAQASETPAPTLKAVEN